MKSMIYDYGRDERDRCYGVWDLGFSGAICVLFSLYHSECLWDLGFGSVVFEHFGRQNWESEEW
jgi:hypothetical protein